MKKKSKEEFEKFYNNLDSIDRFCFENINSGLNGLIYGFLAGVTMKYVSPVIRPGFTIE